MSRGPCAVAVTLSDDGRAELEAMTRSRSLPNSLVHRELGDIRGLLLGEIHTGCPYAP